MVLFQGLDEFDDLRDLFRAVTQLWFVGGHAAWITSDDLLHRFQDGFTDVVIVDVTGVPLMDTGVANHLLQMTNAASLVGARTILVGITPRVAQTIIELGVDLSSITTRSNLQGGVEYALRLQGQHIALTE